MTPIKNFLWQAFYETYKKYADLCPELKFSSNAEAAFSDKFEALYDKTKEEYMALNVENLDAHKQAAIAAICFSLISPITYSKDISENDIFVLNENVGLSVAFSYMSDCLNEQLKEKNINLIIDKYCFPEVTNSNESYFDMLCRNMYHDKTNGILDKMVLDLSNTLFLIECLTLKENGISMNQLR